MMRRRSFTAFLSRWKPAARPGWRAWELPGLLAIVFLAISPWGVQPTFAQTVPIPQLALWQTQMLTYGQQHCTNLANIKDGPLDPALGATYYDMTRVMHQLAAYTGDTTWLACADDATYAYRDRYVLPNNGAVPGYWNFSTGMRMDWQRTGNSRSQQGVLLLSTNAAYTSDYTDLSWIASFNKVREVSYALLSYIDAEAVGQAKRARRATYVTLLYDHLAQLTDPTKWGTDQVSPFMMALAAEALIRDWEQTRDARLVPALSAAADFFWTRSWDSASQSMFYQVNPADVADGGSTFNPAPDLNLLIAPLYAWLYTQTGDTKYLDRGDSLFAGGVLNAFLQGNKQYNQNYRWSFDYVKWRSAGAASAPIAATVTFTAPTNGSTVQGTVTVSASATGSVSSIRLYLDGAAVTVTTGGSTSYVWNTALESNANHTWKATAYDAAGNSLSSSTITATVANPVTTGLTVAFTSPVAGATVSGTTMFTIGITGASGATTVVATIDGAAQGTHGGTSTGASFGVDTTKLSNGAHTVAVKVTDGAGKTGNASIPVTVANGVVTPPVTGLTVVFASPAAGTTVSGTTMFTIGITGASGATTVVATIDGAAQGTHGGTSTGASFGVDTTKLSNGAHTVAVKVTDGAGKTGNASISVTVANGVVTPPVPGLTVVFTSPAAGTTVSGTTKFTIGITGASGATTVVATLDGAAQGTHAGTSTAATFGVNTTKLSNGAHTVAVKVTDSAGKTGTASINVFVSNGGTK